MLTVIEYLLENMRDMSAETQVIASHVRKIGHDPQLLKGLNVDCIPHLWKEAKSHGKTEAYLFAIAAIQSSRRKRSITPLRMSQ